MDRHFSHVPEIRHRPRRQAFLRTSRRLTLSLYLAPSQFGNRPRTDAGEWLILESQKQAKRPILTAGFFTP
jgi:hypothetical protein